MFQYIGSDNRTDVVVFGQSNKADAPTTVLFRRDGNDVIELSVQTFQILRRAVAKEKGGSGGSAEHKIWLIKAVRDLTKLSLRDAKDVAEYFMDNYSIDCGWGR